MFYKIKIVLIYLSTYIIYLWEHPAQVLYQMYTYNFISDKRYYI